jgi:hypothetical protein
LPLALDVHAANIQDRDGGVEVSRAAHQAFPSLRKLWADSGYSRKFVQVIEAATDLTVEVVKHPNEGRHLAWARDGETPNVPTLPAGFQVVRWRWIVERTFAWMSRNRRLAKEYEESTASSVAWMRLSLIRLLAARLAR